MTRLSPTLALAALVTLLGACGGGGRPVQVGGAATTGPAPRTSTTAPGPPACRAAQLRADQVPISAGTSQYYLAWSLTDVSPLRCTLGPGRPQLHFDDAAGRSVVRYTVSDLPARRDPVVVAPGRAAWFLTEELGDTCPASTQITGGPFGYRIGLPGGEVVRWDPGYLRTSTLSDLCPAVELAVGGLQSTRPTP